ncbi:MAG: NfeD family protein [Nitrospiria bacterium]
MAMTPEVLWLSLGLLLLGIEVVTGGFWIGFFGLGALVAAGLLWLGVVHGIDGQLAAFVVASVLPLAILRKPLVRWLDAKAPDAISGSAAGDSAVVVDAIAPKGRGRVEYQGSTWDAESDAGDTLVPGTRVRIVRQDGTRLFVR